MTPQEGADNSHAMTRRTFIKTGSLLVDGTAVSGLKLETASLTYAAGDEGRILSDPVAKYLPHFATNGKAHVTIRDMLRPNTTGNRGDRHRTPLKPALYSQRIWVGTMDAPIL
jgi:DMSO/TMAO reductase YedYZ molybdopterin-dependent catalytic subunit